MCFMICLCLYMLGTKIVIFSYTFIPIEKIFMGLENFFATTDMQECTIPIGSLIVSSSKIGLGRYILNKQLPEFS